MTGRGAVQASGSMEEEADPLEEKVTQTLHLWYSCKYHDAIM